MKKGAPFIGIALGNSVDSLSKEGFDRSPGLLYPGKIQNDGLNGTQTGNAAAHLGANPIVICAAGTFVNVVIFIAIN